MEHAISKLIQQHENGELTRRQLVSRLAGLVSLAAAAAPVAATSAEQPTFRAVGLNHLALATTDVARSRDFYVRHLGLEVARDAAPASCFLNCGPNFVALFRAGGAGMHHYCYSIPGYDQRQAAERLRSVQIEPRLEGNRIYFEDPDGLTVQLASPDHRA